MDNRHRRRDNPLYQTVSGDIGRVYSYHLAWTGDPGDACRLTEQTALTAVHWQDRYHPQESTPTAWWLGIARYVRSFPQKKLSSQLPVAVVKAEQADLDRISLLASHLARLQERPAEALALKAVAGLTEEEISTILGAGSREVQLLLEQGLKGSPAFQPGSEAGGNPSKEEWKGFEASLAALTSRLSPGLAWFDQAAQLFYTISTSRLPKILPYFPGPAGRRMFGLRSAWRWAARHSPEILVGVLVTLGLIGTLVVRSSPPAVPSPTVESTPSINSPGYSPVGWLVPPDLEFCEDWQARFTYAFDRPADLTAQAAYSNPTMSSTDPGGKGVGCRIEVTGSGLEFPDPDTILGQAHDWLYKEGFFIRDRYDCGTCRPGNYMFGDYWNGAGFSLHAPARDQVALLSLAWKPAPDYACPPLETCSPPLSHRLYALRLTLASSAAHQALDQWFDLWQQGDPRLLDRLSPALRQRIPDQAALEAMAGFDPAPLVTRDFSWQVVENSGDTMRVNVWGTLESSIALPSRPIPIFQLVIGRSGQEWEVTNFSAKTIFPLSHDRVYWADEQGRVVSFSLDSRSTQVLTPPGTYNPTDADGRFYYRDPPQISSDGRWLSLHQPDTPSTSAATLLIDLQNPGQVVRLPFSARLAWSVDGAHLAYFRPDSRHELYLLGSPFTGSAHKLAALNENLLSLAWSPDGKVLATLTGREESIPAPSDGTPVERGVVLIDRITGETRSLTTLSMPAAESTAIDLVWTPDNREVWIRPLQKAVDIQTGTVYPLLSSFDFHSPFLTDIVIPLAPFFPGAQYPSLPIIVSPDWKWSASHPGTIDVAGPSEITVYPTGEERARRWAQYFDDIATLAWTSESQNLIAGGEVNQPGRVVRLNASMGEYEVITHGVFWIGVGSDMLGSGLSIARQASVQPIPIEQRLQDWPCRSFGEGIACIRYPSTWKLSEVHTDEWPSLAITNLRTESNGWFSLRDGTTLIQIIDLGIRSDNPPPTPEPGESDYDGLPVERVPIGGSVGLRINPIPGLPEDMEIIFLVLPLDEIIIAIRPASAYQDPIVQQILQSIEFRSGEQQGEDILPGD